MAIYDVDNDPELQVLVEKLTPVAKNIYDLLKTCYYRGREIAPIATTGKYYILKDGLRKTYAACFLGSLVLGRYSENVIEEKFVNLLECFPELKDLFESRTVEEQIIADFIDDMVCDIARHFDAYVKTTILNKSRFIIVEELEQENCSDLNPMNAIQEITLEADKKAWHELVMYLNLINRTHRENQGENHV